MGKVKARLQNDRKGCWRVFAALLALCALAIFAVAVNRTNQVPKEELEQLKEQLSGYSDIIVSVITAIIVALVSIAVTIFVFLKSALDRMIDDNRYISKVANKYKSNSVKELFCLCEFGFATLVISLVLHYLISFGVVQSPLCFWILLVIQMVLLMLNFGCSVRFWKKCIRLEHSLQNIIKTERRELKKQLKQELKLSEQDYFKLIGDWDEWETENLSSEELIEKGKALCSKMTEDQFINLFLRAQILLLSGERGFDQDDIKDSDIITVLQERDNILKPNTDVGILDLEGRRYLGDLPGSPTVSGYMAEFEQCVGYWRGKSQEQKAFFQNTQKLYEILEQYRDLLISQKFTAESDTNEKEKEKEKEKLRSEEDLRFFAQGLYYFFLRILAVFVSALHIKDFSFNGSTLIFANFYSSILEDVSLYSALFYHTIFARAQLIRAVMDVSLFESIEFYNTRFTASTLNNASLTRVRFEGAQLKQTGLSSCTFQDCEIKDSDFEDCVLSGEQFSACKIQDSDFEGCVLSGSQFSGCKIYTTDFLHCKMRDIQWEQDTVIDTCNFIGADIYNWQWKNSTASMQACDFSESIWRELEIHNGMLTDCDFSAAELVGAKFTGTSLNSTLFERAVLAEGRFENCQMEQASMEKASLFRTKFVRTEIPGSNLIKAAAVFSSFHDCNLSNSDCSEADFSKGDFKKTIFQAARLYDCSFTEAEFSECNFDYILANHLQFTFTKCKESTFIGGFLSDSNLSGTEFDNCTFQGGDLTQMNATKVKFTGCSLEHVDFSETRFVDAEFRSALGKGGEVCGCNFSGCKFENVVFNRIVFRDCIFTDALFIHCKIRERVGKERPLRRDDLEQSCTCPEEQMNGCVFLG